MTKTILITGSSDGIGLAATEQLLEQGHKVILHGRNAGKLKAVTQALGEKGYGDHMSSIVADLSSFADIDRMANEVLGAHQDIDVLVNNAGILKTPVTRLPNGLDVRFMVNTIAPKLLTDRLWSLIGKPGKRIINLSSAAQAQVSLSALRGETELSDMGAYSQSKLAITMWSQALAEDHPDGPLVIALNPASLIGTKMVREGFGTQGQDICVGSDIIVWCALSDDLEGRSGQYFDNDSGQFAPAHSDVRDNVKVKEVVEAIDEIISRNV